MGDPVIFTGELRDCQKFEWQDFEMIWGRVVNHTSPKYQPGDWFVTSAIVKVIKDEMAVVTMNSIYRVDALNDAISLTDDQCDLVYKGFSPKEAITLNSSTDGSPN